MTKIVVLTHSNATLRIAAKMAAASHLTLIERNGKMVLSPVMPEGWRKVGGGTPDAPATNEFNFDEIKPLENWVQPAGEVQQ